MKLDNPQKETLLVFMKRKINVDTVYPKIDFFLPNKKLWRVGFLYKKNTSTPLTELKDNQVLIQRTFNNGRITYSLCEFKNNELKIILANAERASTQLGTISLLSSRKKNKKMTQFNLFNPKDQVTVGQKRKLATENNLNENDEIDLDALLALENSIDKNDEIDLDTLQERITESIEETLSSINYDLEIIGMEGNKVVMVDRMPEPDFDENKAYNFVFSFKFDEAEKARQYYHQFQSVYPFIPEEDMAKYRISMALLPNRIVLRIYGTERQALECFCKIRQCVDDQMTSVNLNRPVI